MIVKCTEADRQRLLDYIEPEPEINQFIYGDLANYPVDCDVMNLYALVGEGGEWDAILLRFHDNYVVYSHREDYPAAEAAGFLGERPFTCLNGKESLVRRIHPYFPERRISSDYMSRCDGVNGEATKSLPEGAVLRALDESDFEEYMDLIDLISEFVVKYNTRELREFGRKRLSDKLSCGELTLGLFIGGRLVSVAGFTAASDRNAMVGGVATHPDSREHGYASIVVAELCRRGFDSGKKYLCLFYDNPVAGRIYNRIGFKEIGKYAMLID